MFTAGSEMLIALCHGDQKAFKLFFEQYHSHIYHFAFRLVKCSAQAEDIVQETILRVWLNREQLDPALPVDPYIFTIARRLSLNVLRQAASTAAFEKIWSNMAQPYNDTEAAVSLSDLRRAADQTLQKLPRQQQLVFQLSRYEGLDYDEISDRLHISRNTVKNHLVAALKKMRTVFYNSDLLLLALLIFR